MAGGVHIVWNDDAFTALRTSTGVKNDLDRRAELIAAAAGGEDAGFKTDGAITNSGLHYRASVRTGSLEAIRAERRDRVLTRAVDAGRE